MTKREEENTQESYSTMVNNNAMLLSFEGWIKFIEGFTRGLQSTKTVDSVTVMDCIGEILEYMQILRKNLLTLLQYCESVLEEDEILKKENEELKQLLQEKLERKDGKEMPNM